MRRYKVVLLEDLLNYGRKGSVVSVRPGFARNWLLPNGKVALASRYNLKRIEALQKARAAQSLCDREDSLELSKRLRAEKFEILVKVGPDGQIYGSVSVRDIMSLIKDYGDVDRKSVLLKQPIKTLGSYKIPLKLKEGVEAIIHLEVKAEETQ